MQLKNDQKNISNFAKKWEKTWCQWRSLEKGKVKIEDLREFQRTQKFDIFSRASNYICLFTNQSRSSDFNGCLDSNPEPPAYFDYLSH